jgi:ferric-chelate reductase
MSGSDTHSFISSRSQVQSLDPFLFVFHINVVLLGLFGLYVALTIPRALVYLFQPSDVFNGFFLRSGLPRAFRGGDTPARSATIRSTKPMRSISTRKNQIVLTTAGTCGEDMGGGGIWQTQPSPLSPPALVVPQVAAARLSRRHVSSPRRAPTRVPRWGTIVHPTIAYALNFRVAPGFSFGKLLVLLAYATVMAYAVILRSDPFTDPVRAGYVAMSQIPIAVALAGKTNWLSWASGVSYQKVPVPSLHCTSPETSHF